MVDIVIVSLFAKRSNHKEFLMGFVLRTVLPGDEIRIIVWFCGKTRLWLGLKLHKPAKLLRY